MKLIKPHLAQLQIRYSVRNMILIGTFSKVHYRSGNITKHVAMTVVVYTTLVSVFTNALK